MTNEVKSKKKGLLKKSSGMKFSQAVKLAMRSLSGSKTRALLTMLGIIIGVAAVIVLVSLIGGFSADLTESFESMGTNMISVSIVGRGGNMMVDPDDFGEIVDENPDLLSHYSPTVTASSAAMKYDGVTYDTTTITGCSEDYLHIRAYELSDGRFIGWQDVNSQNKVIVIGSYLEQALFGGRNAVGEDIMLNGMPYTIIGVLAETEDSTESSADDMILLPYTSAQRLTGNAQQSSYTMSAAFPETADAAVTLLEDELYDVFGNEDSYRVMSQTAMLDMVNEMTGTLTLMLVGIAAISLLVGGIGIMNIMLVSVTERTREIGIRKSLGGKRRDIMRQFVIEAGVTSATGGVIGIVVGIAAAYGAASLFDLPVAVSFASVAIAFSVSVAIGVIFGYFPAAKAAKLNPIEALRYD